MQACPALKAAAIATTGDVIADRQKVRAAYAVCAAKVARLAQWRTSHAK